MEKLVEFLKWLLSAFLKQKTATPTVPEPEGVPETPGPNQGGDGGPKPKGVGVRIAISSGHGARVPGAVGILDEVREARRVVRRVAKHLGGMGVAVHEFHDDESDTPWRNLGAIIGWHNRQERDMDVSVHFNAFSPTDGPRGTEVLHLPDSKRGLALRIAGAVAAAGGFRYRGAKERTDLAFLNLTDKPAVLIEVCFVDSATDARLYGENFDAICRAIADALAAANL